MIKINLFKSLNGTQAAFEGQTEISQISEGGSHNKFNFFKHLVVMFSGIGALFFYENYNLPNLKSQLDILQGEINEATTFNDKMSSLKKEIERYENDLKRLNIQTDFLQKTQAERMLSVDLITSLKKIISPKVWLTKVGVRESSIEISGEAETEMDINHFNNNLVGTSFLKDVITTSINLKTNTNNVDFQVYTFSIKASYIDGKMLFDSSSLLLENMNPTLDKPPQKKIPTNPQIKKTEVSE